VCNLFYPASYFIFCLWPSEIVKYKLDVAKVLLGGSR
jgi:hypothetical protein